MFIIAYAAVGLLMGTHEAVKDRREFKQHVNRSPLLPDFFLILAVVAIAWPLLATLSTGAAIRRWQGRA